jgi:antitoxin HigA-1
MKAKRTMSKLPITIKGVPLGPAEVLPGEILEQEFMLARDLNQTQLAEKMGVDRMRVSEIIRGERAITADTALRLAAVFGTTARFWLGLQNDHDLAIAAKRKLRA